MSKGDDDGWRERLGIDFHIELSDSDIEDDLCTSRGEDKSTRAFFKNSGTSDDLAAPEDVEGLESFDSFTHEEEELAHYLKEFGKTPPRTARQRRQKERDAYCSQAKEAAKTIKATLKRRNTAERFLSLPGFSDHGIPEVSPEKTRQQYREQKRSKDRVRSQDRELKQSTLDNPTNAMSTLTTADTDERCESLPPLSPAVKVDSKSRYMSVSCRKLGDGADADQTDDRKVSTAELPPERVCYFAQLQSLLKTGSQETAFNHRQRSEEEVLYQQELYEMLWLELQAWQAGLDSNMFDIELISRRHEVYDIIQEVLSFKFDPNKHEKHQDNVEIPSKMKITTVDELVTAGELRIAGIAVSSADAADGVGISRMAEGEDDCVGCLSIWCKGCQDKQTECLIQVASLLKRLDYVESLFPSTKKLALHFPEWEQTEFVNRYKALCVWYNTSVQLRMKIEVLGKLLGNMTNTLIPWPTFSMCFTGMATPTSSYDSGAPLATAYEESPQETETQACSTTSSVRFVIDYDKTDASSNPSDSSNSTDSGHTTASTNSGLLMPPGHMSAPPPGGLRRCLSDIFMEANPYRKYVEKLLRNKGMKKTFDKVAEVIRDVMSRTMCILEEPHRTLRGGKLHRHGSDVPSVALAETLQELNRFGPWTPKFESMELPPFYAMFIFLAAVSLQMMRECLKLRLEQMPEKPSRLSIKELMREYKEGVKFAVVVRQKYLRSCQALFTHLTQQLRENLELRQNQAIEELDANIKRLLEVYLEWLDQFVCMLHREPHASSLQRNFLQEEWRFVQATCPHVTEGDSLAATRFCNIACHMLCSVGDFIDTGIDDQMAALQDSTLENLDDLSDDDDLEQDDIQKKRLLQRCRALQVLLAETRERALRAAGLAKMLRKDLEVAAEFCLRGEPSVVLDKLRETGHIRVIAPHSQNHFIFVPGRIKDKREYIWHLLDMRVGGIGLEHEDDDGGGYMILMRCDEYDTLSKLWTGKVIEIEPTADCTITLSRVMVTSLLLVVSSGTILTPVRREFQRSMGNTVALIHDQTAPNKAVTHSIDELKGAALELCESLLQNIKQVENMTDLEQTTPDVEDGERRQLRLVTRDVVHQYFMFGFEYHKEVTRLVTGQHRADVAPLLVSLARMWMTFIESHYSHGKGSRPRWANAGLEFIVFVCDPHNTKHLKEEDFQQLVREIESCRAYIVGTAPEVKQPTTPLTPVLPRHFRSSSSSSTIHLPPERSLSTQSSQSDYSPVVNPTESPFLRRNHTRRSHSSMEKPVDQSDCPSQNTPEKPIERVRKKIVSMDLEIDDSLREDKVIGRVSNTQRDRIHFKPRSVSFSWQRGFKIGAGRFGKVYTAVNNNTGELMAMKVLPLQPNDHRSIRRVADELRIFEGISHPHLVQCYGVEIHNDEMLMFMEYCEEGTLESLATSTETGLPEELVRKYTRQLLEAVNVLHEQGVVHRDIKGANIFLSDEANTLKLGDFGCAVRLRGHQTEIGELAGIVGTHAYMAPEIFQSSEGHGRAADVWSVGCVVIEMATGKRPWPQYDSSVQIMFRVGMGESPSIPKQLSEEGHEFLGGCFVHDPKSRSTVAQLLDQTFVKVDTGEDCTSLPLFSHTPFVPYMKLLSST
ncbi:mitogen-activated protein kinase kinase kinase 4-like isoform X2 [Homarus americanus]|uniref:mitogen-activated protein kinase kinase kinase 4-like isoform X2 n=1 Tax=Homarus americanus TaxID=6706 RepID=UPI001C48A760|nr:mitogen-activated protein kinase kinase kinase 4-like isoform X2 [Homarus americanus]